MKILIQIKLVILFFVLSTTSLLAQSPTISSFQPTSGAIGTIVSIRGANLINTSTVTIGGTSSIILAKTDSSLLAMVMPNAITGTIDITTPGGNVSSLSNFTINATSYPTTPQIGKLIGTGAIGSANQGYHSAISADGNTIVIGGHEDNGGTGAVWIFVRVAGKWSQQGNKLVGADAIGNAHQGYRVAISADGNTILSTGYTDNVGVGAAWVFTRTNGTWTQQGAKLLANDVVGNAKLGSSCGISADGNTFVVGGPDDDGLKGAAWVFIRTGTNWTQQGNKLIGTGANGNAAQATGLAISADGNTIAIGGPKDDTNIGATWVFTRTAGVWSQQGTKLVGTGYVGNAEQGISTSLNANGSTLAIGAWLDNTNAGATWIFTWDGFAWTQQGNKLVGADYVGSANQGVASSLSADGNTLVYSGYNDDGGIGAAWIFTRSAGVWSQQGNKLIGSGAIGVANQGCSVSITPDASSLILSGNMDDNSIGATWVFNKPSNDANLSNLSINAASLSPTFDPNVTTYSATVNFTTTSVDLSFINANNQSTISLNGTQQLTNTVNKPLSIGNNTFTYLVTAGDGLTTKTYTVNVTRSSLISSVTLLSNNANTALASTDDTIKLSITTSSAIQTPTIVIAGVNATVTNTSGNNWLGTIKVNSSTPRGLVSFSIDYSDLLGNNGATITSTTNGSSIKVLNILDLAGLTKNSLASAAYSLRKLSSNYNGNSIQVRRTSDNATLDIGFDVNGVLDTVSLKTFVGSADGTVYIWYDQSGNGGDATSETTDQEPFIIQAGILVKLFNVPNMRFTSGVRSFKLRDKWDVLGINDNEYEMNVIFSGASGVTKTIIGCNHELGFFRLRHSSPNTINYVLNSLSNVSTVSTAPNIINSTFAIAGARYYQGAFIARKDGVDGNSFSTSNFTSAYTVFIGKDDGINTHLGGRVAEFFIFPNAINTDRSVLEANQNAYYFPPKLSNVNIQSNFRDAAKANKDNTITVSFTANEPIQTPTITIAGKTASVSNPSANNWQGVITVDNTTPLGVASINITYKDLIGNSGTTVTNTTNASAVTVDTTLSIATLSGFTINAGTLTPAFDPTITSYSATVSNATSFIKITPTSTASTATIKVNGTTINSGAESSDIPLSIGLNTITLLTKAADSTTTKTYTLTVRRLSSNANLSNLITSSGTLSPVFNSDSLNYTSTLCNDVLSITLTPTSADGTATIKVNGTTVASGAASNSIALSIGQNTINVEVTAGDGVTVKNYTVNVTVNTCNNLYWNTNGVSAGIKTANWSITGAAPFTTGFTSESNIIFTATSTIQYVHFTAIGNLTITNASSVNWVSTGTFISLGSGINGTIRTFDIGLGSSLNWNGQAVSSSSGTGFIKNGEGYWLMGGQTGAFSGGFTLNAGAVILGSTPNTIGVGPLIINGGVVAGNGTAAKVPAVSSITVNANFMLGNTPTLSNANASLTFNSAVSLGSNATRTITVGGNIATGSTGVYTFNGVISGSNSGIIFDRLPASTGFIVLSGANTYNGGTTIRRGKVSFGASNVLANVGFIHLNGGTLSTGVTTGFSDTVGVLNLTANSTIELGTGSHRLYFAASNGQSWSSDSLLTIIGWTGGYNRLATATGGRIFIGTNASGLTSTQIEQIRFTNPTTGLTHTAKLLTTGELVPMGPAVTSLSNLTTSSGSLSPTFHSDSTSYRVRVGNLISSLTLTPTTINDLATINVNGTLVSNGNASGNIPLSIGANTITIVVTAEDNSTKTYTLVVTRESTDATLSNLILSTGTISPVFASGTNAYTTSVDFTVSSITLTPTATNYQATIKVNGTTVSSGAASGSIALSVGANTITTVVTAGDGTTTNTYTVTVTRNFDATLSNLSLSSGTLTPVFASGTFSYTATVSPSTNSITVTPTASVGTSTITVNGTSVASGAASGSISLSTGPNTITTVVTASDGTTKTYSLIVNRQSSDATLSNLTISNGTLSPVFTSNTTSYISSTISAGTNSITITPTANNNQATILVNGSPVVSGQASASIVLSGGLSTHNIDVTAGDGTTLRYTIRVAYAGEITYWNTDGVSRNMNSSNWSSTGLAPFNEGLGGCKTIVFSANSDIVNDGYSILGLKITNSSTVNWQRSGGSFRMSCNEINGMISTFDIGTGSSLLWNGQAIYAASGTGFVKNGGGYWYMGNMTGAYSGGFTLNDGAIVFGTAGLGTGPLVINGGQIATSGTTTKTPAVSSVTIGGDFMFGNSAALTNANGSLTFNSSVSLGSSVTRTITVGGDITTGSTGVYTFNGVISGNNSGIIFDRLPAATGRIVLSGANTYNGGTTIRGGKVSLGSSNVLANAGSINLNGGTLNTGVTTGFSDEVGVLTLSANSTIELGTGSHTLSFAASNGQSWTGATVLTITGWTGGYNNLASATGGRIFVGTDGTGLTPAQVEQIRFNHPSSGIIHTAKLLSTGELVPIGPTIATLSNLTISSGTLSPVFESDSINYVVSVGNATTSVTITPTTTNNQAIVKINGVSVLSGNASGNIPLTVGVNTINILVTAGDSVTTKTYTVRVTRAASSNADLSNLTISAGTLDPVFSTGTTSYTASVSNATSSVTITPTTAVSTSTITVNGTTLASGVTSGSISLAVGSNTITTIVTAEDGVTTKTYTINLTRIAAPSISTSGTLTALSTTYGAASSSISFNVSGTNMLAGILVSPPTGFEVSTDNNTFTNTVLVGSAGTISSTPVYIRLHASNAAGNYSGNIVLSSSSATNVNVATVLSTVYAKEITVTVDAKIKVYGDADPSFTYTYTPALIGVDAFTGSLTRAIGENIGKYAINQGTLALSSNYTITYNRDSLSITKKTITVTADVKNKVYGDADPSFTYTYTPALIGADSFTGSLSRATGENIGKYAITQGTLSLSSNYAITYDDDSLSISTKSITVIADAKTKVYGDADPSFTYTYTPALVGADAFTGTLARTAGENIGKYAITQGSLSLGTNYSITYDDDSLSITIKTITVTADAKTKVYGDADPSFTYTYTPALIGADAFSGSLTRTVGENIGKYAITQGTLALNSNYTITYDDDSLSITKKTITVTVDAKTKVYGDVDPSFTYTYAPALIGADAFSGSLTRATGENMGMYAITQGTLALSSNYTITYHRDSLSITAKTITVTTDAKTKVYGESDPTFTYTFSPALIGTDAFTGALTRTAGESVGKYAIKQGTLSLGSNYTITYEEDSLSIHKKDIAIIAQAKTKIYGEADPAFTYTYSPALIGTDVFSGALTRTAGENIGTYAINIGTLAVNANYNLQYTSANLRIDKRVVTVIADTLRKIYGDTDPTLTYSYSPALALGDAFTGIIARDLGEFATSLPYKIRQFTLSLNSNYTLIFKEADFFIDKKDITITAEEKTKVYGDADPLLTYTFSPPLVGSDEFISGNLLRVAGENIGKYKINLGSLNIFQDFGIDGISVSDNYNIIYLGDTLTITRKAITVTADAITKVYGDADPSFTYTYTPALIGADAFTGALARTAGENIGKYAINQGTLALSSNYTITYNRDSLSITKKTITVTADAITKVYGDADPTFTYTYTPALIGADVFNGNLTRATGENIGKYVILQGSLSLGANYTITYDDDSLSITTKTITVTADAKAKVYGDADPSFTYTYTPALIGGDAFTGSLTRATGENIGKYAINQGTLALSSNYTITYHRDSLSITKKTITVTADAKTKVYGDTDPSFTYTYAPALIGADAFTGALARTAGENIGVYAISQGTLVLNSNYVITFVGSNLTIGTRPVSVKANAQGKNYGDVDPALTYLITSGSLVGTDAFTGSLVRVPGETVGKYSINQGSLALNSNYNLTYLNDSLTIGTNVIVVKAVAKSKIYGSTDPLLTYAIVSGSLSFGDSFTGSLARAVGENVGIYSINQGTLSLNPSYTLIYQAENLSITTKTITVTADAKTKVYGDADPSFTYTYTPALIGTDAFTGTLARTAGENIGKYSINQGTLSLGTNYTITYDDDSLSITTRTITVTADAKTKVYGDADPLFTYTYTPALIGTDAFTGTLARTAGENIGKYAINQGTLALSSNYTISYNRDSLNITKKTITVTADAKTKVYGDADPLFTYTYTPALIGTDAFTGTLARTAGENIGKYSINQGTLSLGTNYTITYDDDSLSITTKTITVTADAKTKVYGDADPLFTYTYTPALIGADAFTGALARTAGENIGKYAINQGTLSLGANYTITYDDDSLSITKKLITVTADAKTKVYGDADPSFTYTYTPALVGADAFVGSLSRTTGENIGKYAINQGTLALSSNYTISYNRDSLNITKKTITVTADAKTKVYGDADPSFTYTFTPALVGADAFTGTLTRTAGENIGKYAITQGTLSLNSNYTITYNRDSLSITKKTITVTADAKTKVYGDADPSFTYTYTPALIGADAFTGTLARTAGENIGKYVITQGTLSLNSNYTITYNRDSLNITKKTITVTADAKTKVYGDADPSFTYSFTPALIGADAFTGTLARTAGENIGKYAINQGTLSLGANYTITYYDDSLSITKKTITVTADAKTKVYGDADPSFTYTFTPALVGADAFAGSLSRATGENIGKYVINQGTLALSSNYTISYNRDSLNITKKTITVTADAKAKVYGDSDPLFTYTFIPSLVGADAFTGSLTRTAGENIGKYAINQGTLALSSNYTITYNRDSLSITKKTITVTADAKTKVYGDADPSFTYTYTPALIGADVFTGNLTRTAGENIGKYAITQGTLSLNSNYTITYNRDSLSITKKTITVTADAKTKVYGDADPSFTYSFTPALIGTDAFTGTLTRTAGENIGKYAINQGTLALNSNYTITYNRDSLSITKKTITVNADAKTKVYGDADPSFTYSFTPALIGADAFTGSLTRTAGENIGKYAINQGTLALSSNYTITYNRDSLSITKKTITVTADAKTKVYGDTDPLFTYTYTPALIGADAFTGTLARTAGENIGKYAINQGTLALSSNYIITYTRDSLSITKKTITVTADAKTKVYGDADPLFTYTFTPALIGADAFTGTLARTAGENIGKYAINQGTLALSSNYIITYTRDSLSITKKTITVTADAKTKVYGDADPLFTYTFTPALIGADAFTGSLSRATGENIGKYVITQGSLSVGANYTITYVKDSLSITTKTITVTADAKTKVYGDADPSFTYTFTPALIGADAFTGSLSRATGENIGKYVITQGTLSLGANYTITYDDDSLSITTKTITVIADAKTKVYGDADPSFTYTFTPALLGADAFTGSLSRTTGENIGKYAITQGTLSLGANYAITYEDDSLSITTKTITVTADAKSKMYGDADPLFSYTYTPALIGGDAFSGALARTAGENIGKYAITQGSLSLGTNYTIVYIGDDLNIGSRSITVRAQFTSKLYGDADPVFSYTFSPALIGADAFTGALARIPGESIGKYEINQGSLSLGSNYVITFYNDTLNINPKTITVTADAKVKMLGELDPEWTYTISSALVGSDVFTGKLTRESGEEIGVYPIRQGTLALNSNYKLIFIESTCTILGAESVYLNDLVLSAGKLNPIFDSANFVYNANVSDGINALSVTPFTKNENATITINGELVFNGVPSRNFDITEGLDTLRVTVSLENQNVFNTYKIAIKREVMVVNPTNILSPNGDGVNDLWVIDNIEEYPENRVSLFDRYGKVVFTKVGYSNEWDGTVSGIPLEEDTYYYVIELGTKSPAVKGYITLIRESSN